MVSRNQKNEGIEPSRMQVPAMDRPSIALAWFLDSMMIEGPDNGAKMLVCQLCGDTVCEVEHADTLRVLFNTALAHTCGA